jgi:hypothetical protein
MYTVIGDEYLNFSTDGKLYPKCTLAKSLWSDLCSKGWMKSETEEEEADLEPDTEWSFMTVRQLKEELKNCNLPKTGLKQDMITRLETSKVTNDEAALYNEHNIHFDSRAD